jgi:hypothetical protein
MEVVEGLGAQIIGQGSGRRTGASTPTITIITTFITSRRPIISGGTHAMHPGTTSWGTRLAVKGPKVPEVRRDTG